MPRRSPEEAPIQEEPEQQINLENSDAQREPTLKEKIAEAEKEFDEFKREHLQAMAGSKEESMGVNLRRRLESLMAQQTTQAETERIKAETERLKAEAEMKMAKEEIDRAFGKN